ncbi:hypothetical protein AX17_007052 [Amanita inopinata Kibby_2008]|nr:hypothetical protein AX17_007052 [Amanita inopinata Kibby_2008]
MRFALASLALFAASAAAFNLEARQSAFPPCAQTCTQNADLGGCKPQDIHCTCTNAQFVSSVTKCIISSCQGDDLNKSLQIATQLCLSVGVTLSSAPPMTATGASTGAAPTGSGASNNTGSAAASATAASNSTGSGSAAAPTQSSGASANSINALAGASAFGIAALSLSLL